MNFLLKKCSCYTMSWASIEIQAQSGQQHNIQSLLHTSESSTNHDPDWTTDKPDENLVLTTDQDPQTTADQDSELTTYQDTVLTTD